MTEQSYISQRPDGTVAAYVGPDATQLVRAICLRQGLQLYRKFGMLPTRGASRAYMLRQAHQYTGQQYGRGPAELARAEADLTVWIELTRSSLPIHQQSPQSK